MTTTPLVFVLTMLSVMGYWKQVPDVPETVKAFVDVQQVTQGYAPPPPTLPSKVPLHVKGPVDLACRAVKVAWLFETKRADLTGEEVCHERLNKLYKRGREWYAQHEAGSLASNLSRAWVLVSKTTLGPADVSASSGSAHPGRFF